jgi:TolB-like protein/DNA-binding winged helix-turn-helix (wHTH) protein
VYQPVALGSRALDVLSVLMDRPGELVSKNEIMRAVWPNVVVDEHNLTVQISVLRRILDADRPNGSCIQTVSGRGYRFVVPVTRTRVDGETPDHSPADSATVVLTAAATDQAGAGATNWFHRTRGRSLVVTSLVGCLLLAAAVISTGWHYQWFDITTASPRLSIVVMPFKNLSDDSKDNYLADGITDDLTTELSDIQDTVVMSRESAYTYNGRAVDVRTIGRELGVRYVLEGSIRRFGSTLRVNAQLVSAETGAHLWSDRFDEQISELAAGQERIVTRMKDKLGISMVEIENARSVRERLTNPDAFDLILRARSMQLLPPSLQRDKETLALYERALLLDQTSVRAMVGVAFFLIDTQDGWGTFANLERAGRLLTQARALAPNSLLVLNYTVLWLRRVGRCPEAMEAAERALQSEPNRARMYTGIYNELAGCKTSSGHAEEEIELQAKADQLNPQSPWKFTRYRRMGFAALLLGRHQDAITFLGRSLALNPEVHAGTSWIYRWLAAAYARTGQMEQARHWLSEADRLMPYITVRSHFPEDLSNDVYLDQMRRSLEGFRLAGERDHADEDADFGVPSDGILHGEVAAHTPTGAPGVRTIHTQDLARFVAGSRPIIIDTVSNSWGRSIPGAVGLKFAGLGGNFTDTAQDHLRSKMRELTDGDPDRPIVAVGFNSERFDGHNLALRLAALGYTNVYWYRGGREAWEVAGMPETDLDVQRW